VYEDALVLFENQKLTFITSLFSMYVNLSVFDYVVSTLWSATSSIHGQVSG